MAQSEGRTATIELSTKGLERAASVEENNFVIVCESDEIRNIKFHAASFHLESANFCEMTND
jgi:hypothetical protein